MTDLGRHLTDQRARKRGTMQISEKCLTGGARHTRVMPAVVLEPADPPELAESWFGRATSTPPRSRLPPPSRPPPRDLPSLDDPLADAWFR
jgi:hypothetical protein